MRKRPWKLEFISTHWENGGVDHLLAVRADRIGDIILTTPALKALKRAYPKTKLTFLTTRQMAPLLEGLEFIDELLYVDDYGLLGLISAVRKRKFSRAFVFQSRKKIALALFLARLPLRVGPLSKPHSILYNKAVRQHRSEVKMHEAEYNIDLLKESGVEVPFVQFKTEIQVPDESRVFSAGFFREHSLNPNDPLCAIHPGMGGSALNWPQAADKDHFMELSSKIYKAKHGLLFTFGPGERDLAERYKKKFPKAAIYLAKKKESLGNLAALYSRVDVVVAPSTGPLHVAVALDVPVVSIYPPVRVQSAKRWGPFRAENADVFVPEVECPEAFQCAGNRCPYFDCMGKVGVDQVFEAVRKHLEEPEDNAPEESSGSSEFN